MFESIRLRNWRQFDNVEVNFHPELTILTGANGSGKTTLLRILSNHIGWGFQFISTPKNQKKGVLSYLSDWFSGGWDQSEKDGLKPNQKSIGEISYTSGGRGILSVPENVKQQYEVNILKRENIPGIFVPSHRPIFTYQPVSQIPTTVEPREQLFQRYVDAYKQTYALNVRVESSPPHRIKSALISLATFGYGNQAVESNPEAVATFEGFESVLRTVLPPSLGFRRLLIRMPEVVLDTTTGEFSFDAVSGGIASIIDLAWQIYLKSLADQKFVVILDEPENHLHPQLQRTLLSTFIKAFPLTQFIVATHNPFIVGSVPESNVFVLDYNEDRKVSSQYLDLVNRAGTSNEILRNVLGVPFTMPMWVENRLIEITEKYRGQTISQPILEQMKEEMGQLGMGHLFPDAISRVLEH